MKRIHRLVLVLAVPLTAWICSLALLPFSYHLLLAPAYAALLLAAYMMLRLVQGLMSFESHPEDIVILQQEFKAASDALSLLGITSIGNTASS
mmetsp:Transcript_12583/g.27175  ORF Transcript_12583/g.27175 Transcript_12583/m.27175 type:complete len:93 (-) Transcript_12583:651-929(-)